MIDRFCWTTSRELYRIAWIVLTIKKFKIIVPDGLHEIWLKPLH